MCNDWNFGKDLGELYYSNFKISTDTLYSTIPEKIFIRIKSVGKIYTVFIRYLWPSKNNPYLYIGHVTEKYFSILLKERKICKITKEDLIIKDIIE